MSADLKGFNAEEVQPQDSFDPIPAGWYTCMITESEMRPTKTGTGEYLQLRLDVIEGEHQGRVVFDRLNLVNDSQTAVEIAQRQLSAICRAVGVMQPNDSGDLHDKPIRVKVAIRPASGGYDASNEVKAYAEKEGGGTSKPAPGAAASSSGGGGKKPWQ